MTQIPSMRAVAAQFPRRSVFVGLVALALAGCTRPPDIIGVDNAEFSARSVPDLTRHRVFIATTRTPSDQIGAFLSDGRATDLGLASVDVTIPPNHVVGQIERPTTLPPDPRTEFAAIDPVIYAQTPAFVAAIDRELATRPRGKRSILLFVHGYNTTATDGLLRLAQFVEDSGFEGVPILFTWASAAKTPRYVYDLNSALIARGKIKEIADIMVSTRAESADVFAHSMGSLLTMEGLVDLQQEGVLGQRGRINHIMLASPDIDLDLFRVQLAELPPVIRQKLYLLVSSDDSALRASRIIAGGVPRVGASDTAELEALGVTVIDLSEIDDSSAGSHTKFAGSPEVVQLIGLGLNSVSRFDEADTPSLGQLLANAPIRILRN